METEPKQRELKLYLLRTICIDCHTILAYHLMRSGLNPDQWGWPLPVAISHSHCGRCGKKMLAEMKAESKRK